MSSDVISSTHLDVLLNWYQELDAMLRSCENCGLDFADIFCSVELGDCEPDLVHTLYNEGTIDLLQRETYFSADAATNKGSVVMARADAFKDKYDDVRFRIKNWIEHFKSDDNKTDVWNSFKNSIESPQISDEKVQAWFDFYAFVFFYERLTKDGVDTMYYQRDIDAAVKEFNERIRGFQDGMTEEFFKEGLVELLAERFNVRLSYS